jgi:hypothetical protein
MADARLPSRQSLCVLRDLERSLPRARSVLRCGRLNNAEPKLSILADVWDIRPLRSEVKEHSVTLYSRAAANGSRPLNQPDHVPPPIYHAPGTISPGCQVLSNQGSSGP